MKTVRLITSFLVVLGSMPALAMPMKVQMLKPRAYYQEADNNLLEALDLKAKVMSFRKVEFDQCGQNLVRRAQTLTFSCTLQIPSKAKISKLQNLVTARSQEVIFGGTKRAVLIHVPEDARTLTLTTAFDATRVKLQPPPPYLV